MKALWIQDWYRIGKKITVLMAVLFVLMVCFYGSYRLSQMGWVQAAPHYTVEFIHKNRILWYFYNDTLPIIWSFPLVSVWLSGKLVSDDRRSGWGNLCRAMPLTARQYVTEKYLFGLAFMGVGLAAVLLCHTVYVVLAGVFDLWFLTLFALKYIMVLLSVSALLNVLTFRKSFLFAVLCGVLVFWLLPGLLVTDWFGMNRGFEHAVTDIINWLFRQPKGIVLGSAAAVALHGLSYMLSLQIAARSGD